MTYEERKKIAMGMSLEELIFSYHWAMDTAENRKATIDKMVDRGHSPKDEIPLEEATRDTLMLQMLDLKTAAYNVLLDYVAAIEAMEFEDEAAESTELAETLQKALTQAEKG